MGLNGLLLTGETNILCFCSVMNTFYSELNHNPCYRNNYNEYKRLE